MILAFLALDVTFQLGLTVWLMLWMDGRRLRYERKETGREGLAGAGGVFGFADVGGGDAGHDHLEDGGSSDTPGTGPVAGPAETAGRDELRQAGGLDGGGDGSARAGRIEVSQDGYQRWKRERAEARAAQDGKTAR